MRLGARQDVECERQQAVAGQDGRRLVERLVYGRPATPQIVIVHRRQIIMDQRITVHAFERRCRHQRTLARDREQGSAFDHQEWPEPLAAAKRRVAHRLEEALRPHPLARQRRIAEQALEHGLGRACDFGEACDELRLGVVNRHHGPCSCHASFPNDLYCNNGLCGTTRSGGSVREGEGRHGVAMRTQAGSFSVLANQLTMSHHERLGTPDLPGVILPIGFPLQQVPLQSGALRDRRNNGL